MYFAFETDQCAYDISLESKWGCLLEQGRFLIKTHLKGAGGGLIGRRALNQIITVCKLLMLMPFVEVETRPRKRTHELFLSTFQENNAHTRAERVKYLLLFANRFVLFLVKMDLIRKRIDVRKETWAYRASKRINCKQSQLTWC